MSRIIVTAAGPNMREVLDRYTLPSFIRFADRYKYEVQVNYLETDGLSRKGSEVRKARWQKINLIKQALLKHSIVLWLDADTMICRDDEDVPLEPTDYQGLVLHHVPSEGRVNPNTGVWILRKCQKAFDFLASIERIGLPENDRWADQAAVLRALGWILGDERYNGARMPDHPTEYIKGTTWLPSGWNQPYTENRRNPEAYIGRPLVEDPHIIHYMAMSIPERLECMGKTYDKCFGISTSGQDQQ